MLWECVQHACSVREQKQNPKHPLCCVAGVCVHQPATMHARCTTVEGIAQRLCCIAPSNHSRVQLRPFVL